MKVHFVEVEPAFGLRINLHKVRVWDHVDSLRNELMGEKEDVKIDSWRLVFPSGQDPGREQDFHGFREKKWACVFKGSGVEVSLLAGQPGRPERFCSHPETVPQEQRLSTIQSYSVCSQHVVGSRKSGEVCAHRGVGFTVASSRKTACLVINLRDLPWLVQ